MTPTTSQLIQWDRDFLWHPFTPMKPWCEQKDILIIDRAEREFLIDTEGRRYIDGSSSLWCNVHGHNIPELNAALIDQLNKVAHSTLLGLGNVPSILLAKRLVDLMSARHIPLTKVFYSDNGSTAVEVAAKLAYQYWHNLGTPRHKFLALHNAYHGDTLGAVSLGGIPTFHHAFRGLTFAVDFLTPPTQHSGLSTQDFTLHTQKFLSTLADTLATGHYAALIVEPLILGAGGMRLYDPSLLTHMRQLTTQHNTLLIYDEVLTGFGRTGKMFATEHAPSISHPLQNPERQRGPDERQLGVLSTNPAAPDLLCLSKGLTAGYAPLGVTMTSQKIFDAFYADPREGKTFFHGHTFTGHPLACAVALASLDLFDKNNLLAHITRLGPLMDQWLAPIIKMPHVTNLRRLGMIAAFDLVSATGNPFPYHLRIGGAFCTALRPKGILLRPLADTIVIMPPLAITEENLHMLCKGIVDMLPELPAMIQRATG